MPVTRTETAVIELAQSLIRIPSTADNPDELHKAIGLIRDTLSSHPGITIEQFESDGKPSLLAYHGPQRPERFRVLMNGHIDVVAADAGQFEPRLIDGRLYGRGALDMKTAVAAQTQIFLEMAPKVDFPLGLQIVSDEELGGAHGTKYQLEQGVRTDFAIVGESTPPSSICTESRGVCWATVRFKGASAHSAYPWNGVNAVVAASTFVMKLLERYPVPAIERWSTTINIAAMSTTNETFNRVPEEAMLKLDMRYVVDDPHFITPDAVIAMLHVIDPHADVAILQHEPGHKSSPDGHYIKRLADSLQHVSGQATEHMRKYGAADVRYFSAAGSEAVVLGLDGAHMHGPDEYVILESIPRYTETLRYFLQHLD